MSYIYPVILSGGVGSRLWPLSRSHSPKQFLSLASKRTLIQETALRIAGLGFARPLIICHADHRFLVAEQMRAVGVEPENIILESSGRNTAPAAAVAAIVQKDPDAVLLLMPADHVIGDPQAFHEAVLIAQDLAKSDHLVTFGVRPQVPETGYGYVQRGPALRNDGKAFAVSRFVEKPDAATAERYLKAGDYYWNSGIFAFQAGTYLAELQRTEPEIAARCRQAVRDGKQDADCFQLAPESFETCKSASIDYAVMEHTDKAAIVPVEMEWSDIGSWAALADISAKDGDGNVMVGDIVSHNARNSYLRSEGPLIAALGIEDLVVVASPDAVLVGPKSAAQDVKKIVEHLERRSSDLLTTHRRIQHPWGWSECINQDENFRVIRITLNSGASLSLPAGRGWVGHWVITSGTATVTCENEVFRLMRADCYALSNTSHQMENIGAELLCVIEVRLMDPY